MNIRHVTLLAVVTFTGLQPRANAQTSIYLGSAGSFAVLAGTSVTNTGNTTVYGDLGVSPGTSVSGFMGILPGGPGIVNGTIHAGDATAALAQAALVVAYNMAAGETATVSGVTTFANTTLMPGVYNSVASIGISGTLTLDGNHEANPVFIFQMGSTLTTATGSQINLINGALADNVYWQVGSSATLGDSSEFAGDVLANTSITLSGTGTTVDGRLLAQTGTVTLGDNVIAVPEPAGTSIWVAGFAGLIIGVGRIRRHYSDRKLDLRGC